MNSDIICLHISDCLTFVDHWLPDKSVDFRKAYCLGYLDCLKKVYNFSQSLYSRYVNEIYEHFNSN